jgi:hypothetical protein
MKTKINVPSSAANDKKNQSISSADQKGSIVEAHPTVDGGFRSKPGYWVGNGLDIKRIEE